MLDAYQKSKQIVQIGTHQRSWDHFIDAKKILDQGTIGSVTHVLIVQPGIVRAAARKRRQPVPAGLDWDAGSSTRRSGRSSHHASASARWYAYGSGLVATGARITSTSPTGS